MLFFTYLLSAAAGFLTLYFSALIFSLHSSDAAGNAYAQAYAAFAGIALWLIFAVLLAITRFSDVFPAKPAWWMLPVFVFAAVAEFGAFDILCSKDQFSPAFLLQIAAIIIPVALLIRILCLIVPVVHERGLDNLAVWITTVPLLLAAVIPYPPYVSRQMQSMRDAAESRRVAPVIAAEEAKTKTEEDNALIAKIAAYPESTPLWELMPFTAHQSADVRKAALSKIVTLSERQEQAEQMMNEYRDERVLRELVRLDLKPTTGLCSGSRKIIARMPPEFRAPMDDGAWSRENAENFDRYAPSISWLLQNGCDCTPEIAEFEATTLKNFKDTKDRQQFLAKLTTLKNSLRH
ncbi:hypothetical protein Acid345_1101 [Candidatus Koribacter versatilis Ellin345]|uniref:Uncharacterized protein n=1 Tax=Koribacter versatilis (strain Ellin345) TaxID=204669 RepID=Q1ISP6_KORVE|nr:hypothetical protein [Candidatus Koribacter versatilis]ABF40104.1 hypothetical protein Acid345_1101 [Candidatus Koribacter versatilis Ellin345]